MAIKQVFARERLTVTNGAVVTLTAATYDQAASPVGGNQYGVFKRRALAAKIFLTSASGTLNFTLNGTSPTAGVTVSDVGIPAAANDVIDCPSHQAIKDFKAIAITATDAIIEVEYLR